MTTILIDAAGTATNERGDVLGHHVIDVTFETDGYTLYRVDAYVIHTKRNVYTMLGGRWAKVTSETPCITEQYSDSCHPEADVPIDH